MDSNVVSVGVVATLIASQGGKVAPLMVNVQNAGAQTVFLGGPGVTTANGYRLAAGLSIPTALYSGEQLYGVVAATTANVSVLSTYSEGGDARRALSLGAVLGFGRDAGGQQIENVADPDGPQDVATLAWVTANAADLAEALVTARLKLDLVAGGASNADLTLAGITAADTVRSAIMLTAKTKVTLAWHADGLVRTATNTTGDILLVLWYDKVP